MPVRYKESDLVLRRLKQRLLNKIKDLREIQTKDTIRIKQLEVEQTVTAIKVKEIGRVNILKI